MRIVIAEAFSEIPKEKVKEYEDARNKSIDEKKQIINSIIDEYANPTLKNIFDIISQSILQLGIDSSDNEFLQLMDKITFTPSGKSKKNFETVLDMYVSGDFDVSQEYLTRESTYEVPDISQFKFALNALDIVNNPSKLSKYFKYTDSISEEALYIDNDITKSLKPVGNKGDSTEDTMVGTINSWSGKDGENDIADKTSDENNGGPTTDSGDYSIVDALKQQDVPESDYLSFLTDTVESLFKNGKCKYKPKSSNVDLYLSMINLIFSHTKPLSQSELKNIKKDHYVDLSHIPDSKKKEGSVVYVYYKEFKGGSNAANDMSDKNAINDFVIFRGNKWVRYEDKNTQDFSKYQKVLLNSKTVEDKSSHYSITDGVVRSLDSSEFDAVRNQAKKDSGIY